MVLFSLADTLEREKCKKGPGSMDLKKVITFIKEGSRPFSIKSPKPNLLQTARSWGIRVNVRKRLQFQEVVHITLHPDTVL